MAGPALTRCSAPAVVALIALLALAAPAPAARDDGAAPARAVQSSPPSDVDRAIAAERYYSSYGETAPPVTAPADAGSGDGIGVAPFVLALVGALVVGLSIGGLIPLAHTRRRQRFGIAS